MGNQENSNEKASAPETRTDTRSFTERARESNMSTRDVPQSADQLHDALCETHGGKPATPQPAKAAQVTMTQSDYNALIDQACDWRDKLEQAQEGYDLVINLVKAELERVKQQRDELLAACKALAGFSYSDAIARIGEVGALAEFVRLKRQARIAIANAGGNQ